MPPRVSVRAEVQMAPAPGLRPQQQRMRGDLHGLVPLPILLHLQVTATKLSLYSTKLLVTSNLSLWACGLFILNASTLNQAHTFLKRWWGFNYIIFICCRSGTFRWRMRINFWTGVFETFDEIKTSLYLPISDVRGTPSSTVQRRRDHHSLRTNATSPIHLSRTRLKMTKSTRSQLCFQYLFLYFCIYVSQRFNVTKARNLPIQSSLCSI